MSQYFLEFSSDTQNDESFSDDDVASIQSCTLMNRFSPSIFSNWNTVSAKHSLSPSSSCKWWYILKDSRRLEQIGRLRGTVASRAAADSRVLILCKWESSLWVVYEAFTVRALSPSNMPTIGRRRTEMTGAPLSGEDRHSCMKIAITEQSNFSVMPCYLHKPRVW